MPRHSMDGVDGPATPQTALAFGGRAAAAGDAGGAPGGGAAGGGGGKGATSWPLLVGLAAAGIVICYADRSNMSTAIIPMAQELGWDKAYQGVVLSAFFLGYATTQILGGALADKYGGKSVLAGGVALWSLFTGLTPLAAAGGTASLLAARVLLGVGEGVAFPAVHALISRNVPPERQSTAVGVVTAASYAGTALAFGLSPSLISRLGWQAVFYLFGALALLWLPLWAPIREAPPRPGSRAAAAAAAAAAGGDEEAQGLLAPPDARGSGAGGDAGAGAGAAAEPGSPGKPLARRGARQQQQGGGGGGEGALGGGGGGGEASALDTLKVLLRQREVVAICVTQYCQSYGMYGLLTWLPTFFSDYYGVEVQDLGGFTLLPYVVQGAVGAASGALADRLIASGWGVRRTRVVGMLGPAACLLAAVSPLSGASAAAASALITLGLGLSALSLGGVSVSHLDIAPRHAGMVFGAGNTAATLAGLVAVPLTGVLLDRTGSWPTVFSVVGLHYAAGAAAWAAWAGARQLPADMAGGGAAAPAAAGGAGRG
ncbi:MAG: major facilitator superfamily transporter [Monoraphidium minutum]|nr:MAG: major facilitator superfamily transporter [Monoraphidium minutum]